MVWCTNDCFALISWWVIAYRRGFYVSMYMTTIDSFSRSFSRVSNIGHVTANARLQTDDWFWDLFYLYTTIGFKDGSVSLIISCKFKRDFMLRGNEILYSAIHLPASLIYYTNRAKKTAKELHVVQLPNSYVYTYFSRIMLVIPT